MKCENCGFENEKNSTSCISCGNPLIKDKQKKTIIHDNHKKQKSKVKNQDNSKQEDTPDQDKTNYTDHKNEEEYSNYNNTTEYQNEENINYYNKKPKFTMRKLFSTKSITIICIIIIILITLGCCIYAIHMNQLKNYYNENSPYDPEYDYTYNTTEYNQSSYTLNEIYTAHTPQEVKRQMFEESDVNNDNILKGNEISKMDYKLKHSQYTYNSPI